MGAQRGARVRDPAMTISGKDWFSASSFRLFQCLYTRLHRLQVEFTTVHDDTSRQYCEHAGLTTGNKRSRCQSFCTSHSSTQVAYWQSVCTGSCARVYQSGGDVSILLRCSMGRYCSSVVRTSISTHRYWYWEARYMCTAHVYRQFRRKQISTNFFFVAF